MKTIIIYARKDPPLIKIYDKFISTDYLDDNPVYKTHHGVGYMIKYANQHGETVDFLDLYHISWNKFKKIVKNYDLVGYSILSTYSNVAFKAIEINKKVNKNATIVVGGYDPTICTQNYVDNPLIDYVMIGEGEISFLELIKAKKENKLNKLGKIIQGKQIEDLDSLGFINRDIFINNTDVFIDGSHSSNDLTQVNYPSFPIIASRCCLYGCKFCQPAPKTMSGTKLRMRTPEHVVKEIVHLKKKIENSFSVLYIGFIDDNPFQNRDWIIKFIECLKKVDFGSDFKLKFGMYARSNNIINNEDLIDELQKLGWSDVLIGFESGSNKMLKYLGKGTTVEMNKKALNIMNEKKINVSGTFMFGFPNETKKDIELTKKFIKENKIYHVMVFSFNPSPGNYLTMEYKEKNLLYEDSEHLNMLFNRPRVKGVNYYSLMYIIFKLKLINKIGLKYKLVEFIFLILNIVLITEFYIVYNIKKSFKLTK
ncbi:MAG: B12-binding domain-containing radical SAM protein [Methanobrevibacter sp.]|jgi:radical SAM superfamily enzyme YgiQ (UPF0313 family)|nr:B12-binding domain-containing radical SAM protein [Candidatus Methanovirga meridionalis]